MSFEHSVKRYRFWYSKLLQLHSKDYLERFGEGMEQTFVDVLRERNQTKEGSFISVGWLFLETFIGIIKENKTNIIMQNKILRLGFIVLCILLIPLIAMQFTSEVQWTLFDFVFMGILLFGTGLTYELIAMRAKTKAYKLATGVGIFTGLLLIWMNGAVGIIGDEDNPINALYLGIIITGAIGAFVSQLKPSGMSKTLFTLAILQLLVPVIALFIAPHTVTNEPPGIFGVFVLNAGFAFLWCLSAALFRKAAESK